ncbi:MAG: Capsule biosynthesis protein CapB [Ignavibacteriaceae bacterium]|nr:Capsule biosynthesis protein CapB [Ignavibacteriaceae bacterium]
MQINLLFLYTAGTLIVSLCYFITEQLLLNRAYRKVPVRILVTGTRGKSTVTELTALLLRSLRKVQGKITGVKPALIDEYGKKFLIRRRGVRIQEQFRLLIKASFKGYDAVVFETMAVHPDLLKTEITWLNPTHLVITNIRDDHREALGGTRDEQMHWFIKALPEVPCIITADEFVYTEIKKTGKPDDNTILCISPVAGSYSSNALLACRTAELASGKSFNPEEIESFIPQPAPVQMINRDGEFSLVIDGLSINDTDTADIVLERALSLSAESGAVSLLINTRNDRPLRTKQFLDWAVKRKNIHHIYLTGDHIPFALRYLRNLKSGIPGNSLPDISDSAGVSMFLHSLRKGELLFMTGNIHGTGFLLREALEKIILQEESV